jgi:hypothetical protein
MLIFASRLTPARQELAKLLEGQIWHQVEYCMTIRADRPEISYRINSLRPLARRGGAACSGRASETLRREAGHDEAVATLHAA